MVAVSDVIRRGNRWFVSSYKVIGFGVLGALLFAMVSFLGLNLFFLVSRSWVVPVILSPQHEKVTQSALRFVEQTYQVEKLRTERSGVEAELSHIKRAISLHEQFQRNFVRAIQAEESQKRSKLERLSELDREFGSRSAQIHRATQKYRDQTKKQLDEQYKSRLIAQDEMIKGQYVVGQLGLLDLDQRERAQELKDRIESFDNELKALAESTRAMEGAGTNSDRIVPSVDVLMREQQYLQAEIARSELAAKMVPLEQQLKNMDAQLKQQDALLVNLRGSPYTRAAEGQVMLAFVSYDNLEEVKVGGRVLGCYLSFIACRRAGTVVRIIDGEVVSRHPMTNRDVRGVMIELALDNARWAERSTLILNRAPLLL